MSRGGLAAARARGTRHAAKTVATGLDRVAEGRESTLPGRRVALVAHAAAVTREGSNALEVMRSRGVDVARILSPEHGFLARRAAGEAVGDGRLDGIPVRSLYGARSRPAPSDLRDVDALVFDLQDAGVRFYTYLSTLAECLTAAGEAGTEVVVLDRPNPLGGDYVAGPLVSPAVRSSPLNRLPGPLIHGLTSGEMAGLLVSQLRRAPGLRVVEMEGWRREMRWPETGRCWTPPSPNLRTAEAALAYPGVALLEATNVSEGRGTWAPFLRFGAPWLDRERVRSRVAAPGYALYPVRFTPRPSPAAPEPKYAGRLIPGLGVAVTDAAAVDPYALGVELLAWLRRSPGFRWRSDGALDRLVGTPGLREALDAGRAPGWIRASETAGIETFRRERRPFLRYP